MNEREKILFKEYEKLEFSAEQKEEIKYAIEKNFDKEKIDILANPLLSEKQMWQINEGIHEGLDVEQIKILADPNIDVIEMEKRQISMLVDCWDYEKNETNLSQNDFNIIKDWIEEGGYKIEDVKYEIRVKYPNKIFKEKNKEKNI